MDSYMETEFLHLQPHNHHHNQQQPNSGLLRFRSAPSSLLNEFTHSSTDPEKHTGRFEEDEFSESSYERKPQRLNSQNGYSGLAQLPPQYPKQHLGSAASSSIQRSNSLETDQSMSRGLNLSRQNSSPAGFFNHLNPQNDYTIMRGIGNGTNEESSPRLNHLPQIPEIVNVNIKETNPQDLFPFTSWNDSASKSGGLASNPNTLTHHLSLPKTALRFQDTVPCKVRARRGYATHPRSIAERERRNRISERMRKLQELVPNMDKQTNTADMLDLAVEYIKNLQNHHKVLNENQTKCKCVNLQQSSPN